MSIFLTIVAVWCGLALIATVIRLVWRSVSEDEWPRTIDNSGNAPSDPPVSDEQYWSDRHREDQQALNDDDFYNNSGQGIPPIR